MLDPQPSRAGRGALAEDDEKSWWLCHFTGAAADTRMAGPLNAQVAHPAPRSARAEGPPPSAAAAVATALSHLQNIPDSLTPEDEAILDTNSGLLSTVHASLASVRTRRDAVLALVNCGKA